MKLSEELSMLRNSIKKVDTDTPINDSVLYSSWARKRATVLAEELRRKNFIHHSNYHGYCVELEVVKSHNCNCPKILGLIKKLGCDVLQTKVEIPQSLNGLLSEEIKLTTLSGSTIGWTREDLIASEQSNPILKSSYRATWWNRKIIVWNAPLMMVSIRLNGIWTDIAEWADKQHCDSTNPCIDVFEQEVGLPLELSDKVQLLAKQDYFSTIIQVKEDTTADYKEN